MKQMFLSGTILGSMLMFLMSMWAGWTSRKKFVKSREKASPFECGFDPKDKARIPFSVRFFMIIMLFLMFDMELSLLLQLPFQIQKDFWKNRMLMTMFVWLLLMGTLEEWRRGILSWVE